MQPLQNILIADGYEDDAFFTRAALRRIGIDCPTQQVESLSEAMAYLAGSGPYGERERYPMPSVILCDFWLGATELLEWARNKPALAAIPLVAMIGSDLEMDQEAALKAGAAAAFSKSPDFSQLVERLAAALQTVGAHAPEQAAGSHASCACSSPAPWQNALAAGLIVA